MGAPLSTAATPPTTMKSTPCRQRTSSASRNLGIVFVTAQLGDAIDEALKDVQPLARRQGQHPTDQAHVDAILGVVKGIRSFHVPTISHGAAWHQPEDPDLREVFVERVFAYHWIRRLAHSA